MLYSKLACFSQQSFVHIGSTPHMKTETAVILARPRAQTMEQRRIFRCHCPLPFMNPIIHHIGLRAVSVPIQTHQCLARRCQFFWLMTQWHLQACSSSFVPASWLLSRYCMFLFVPLHLLERLRFYCRCLYRYLNLSFSQSDLSYLPD